MQRSADDEGSLLGRRQLVPALVALDQPEHEIALAESERVDPAAVVAAETLLVDR